MALLIDSPSFTANEVYEIQATDAVEGAAIGASFGGIGLSNQPHQQLANRTAFVKQRQDTNIGNIIAVFYLVVQRTDVLQRISADSLRGRKSRIHYRHRPMGYIVSERRTRRQSDLFSDLAAAVSQFVRMGDSITLE
jgi:hypothetical protein